MKHSATQTPQHLARSFELTVPFWFAAAVLAIMFLLTLPLVNNRTVTEARAGSA